MGGATHSWPCLPSLPVGSQQGAAPSRQGAGGIPPSWLFLPPPTCPGAIQSFAGFTDYFTAMAQEGWFPLLCVGLRAQWENDHLQDLQDSYGQEWVSDGPSEITAAARK